MNRETLTQLWLGSHLEYDGLKETLGTMTKKKEPSIPDVHNDWKRLASFMAGR